MWRVSLTASPETCSKGAMNHDSAIRDRNISTIFADWKQTGNICGRFDKVRVFTNFYAVGYANNDVVTGKGVTPRTVLPADDIFVSVFWYFPRSVSALFPHDKSDHRRTARYRSSYIIITYNRSIIPDTDERRVEMQRIALTYDNIVTIKFYEIDACRHFSFGNCGNGPVNVRLKSHAAPLFQWQYFKGAFHCGYFSPCIVHHAIMNISLNDWWRRL